jgi:hypothetical protein
MKRTLAPQRGSIVGERGNTMAAANDSGQQAPATQNTPDTSSASNTARPSVGAQSTGAYPGAVGPTGSKEPDAKNPVRSNPSGGRAGR